MGIAEEAILSFAVNFRGKDYPVNMTRNTRLAELAEALEKESGALASTQKLLVPRSGAAKKLAIGLQLASDANGKMTLAEAGIQQGQNLRLVGATALELQAVVPPPSDSILGFEEEVKRARRRSQHGATGPGVQLPKGPYTFHGFRTLELPGIQLSPVPARALRIMHRLASDPGIVAVMSKHRWAVGIMTELAPVGYVGVSPKCLLGFNKNRGEEISLRLRTDDLRGFRKYDSIRKTLLHELVHMVHDEHDADFKTLNSQLNREAEALDWTRSTGHTLVGEARHSHASWSDDDMEEEDDWDEATVMGATRRSSGLRLGGEGGAQMGARAAAAEAALRRLTTQKAGEASEAGSRQPSPAVERTATASDRMAAGAAVQAESGSTVSWSPDGSNQRTETVVQVTAVEALDSIAAPARGEEAAEPMAVDGNGVGNGEWEDEAAALAAATIEDDARQVDFGPHPAAAGATVEELPFAGPVEGADGESGRGTTAQSGGADAHAESAPGFPPTQPMETAEIEAQGVSDGPLAVEAEMPLDDELARVQAAAAAIGGRVGQAVNKLKREAPVEDVQMALQTIATILRNALSHPGEGRYLRLRKDNATFHRRAGRHPAALEILLAAGFREQGAGSQLEGPVLVLQRDDPGLLWLAVSTVEAHWAKRAEAN